MTFDLEKMHEVAGFMRSYHHYGGERFTEALDEIERLRAELASANVELMAAGETVGAKEARIQELEDALVGEREKTVLNKLNGAPVEFFRDPQKWRHDEAIRQLRAEGKIGPDASKPRSWRITDERKAAIDRCALYSECRCQDRGAVSDAVAVLRGMLEEAGQ